MTKIVQFKKPEKTETQVKEKTSIDWERVAEENAKKQKEQEEERKRKNEQVKKSYGIKS